MRPHPAEGQRLHEKSRCPGPPDGGPETGSVDHRRVGRLADVDFDLARFDFGPLRDRHVQHAVAVLGFD